MLERWEEINRQKGNIPGAEIAQVLRRQYGDEPLPTLEQEPKIKVFSREARKSLERDGYSLFILTGESFQDLSNAKVGTWSGDVRVFFSKKYKHNYNFDLSISNPGRNEKVVITPKQRGVVVKSDIPDDAIRSEVAINLRQPFLPDSNNKPYFEQSAMVDDYSRDLSSRIPEVKAIMGKISDYEELLLRHLVKKNDHFIHLIDSNYEYKRTRTSTPGEGPRALGISFSNPGEHIVVYPTHIDEGINDLYVAPLIIPSNK